MRKNESVVLVPYTAGSAVIASFFPLQKVGEQVALSSSLKEVHSETGEK